MVQGKGRERGRSELAVGHGDGEVGGGERQGGRARGGAKRVAPAGEI